MNLVRTAMLLALMTALFMGFGYVIGGSGGMMIAFLIAAGMNLFSYWNADKMVLRMHHAVEVDERNAPEYFGIVRELAARAELPMPKVYLIDNPQPNAFATGRNPQNAAVAATTGLLDRLTPQEVAGVMAHELAHVQNRDTLTMTITATLAGAISMLGNFAFFMGGNRDNNNPLGFIGVLVAIIVAPLAAMMVQMAISRTREYSADRRGAEICGQPLWLASALDKIARNARAIHNPDAERNPATAHMFIINPLSGERMDNLFSTHPDTGNRIAALQKMAPEFGAPSARRPEPRTEAPQAREPNASGPWGGRPAAPQPPAKEEPQRDEPNPWGRSPTGPKGRKGGWFLSRPGRRTGGSKPASRSVPPAADAPGLPARRAAARLLSAVVDARTPLDGLTDNENGHPQYLALEPRDRALVRAILATALRHRNTIEALIAARLERPLPSNAHALSHILHVAAAQMLFLDVPDSAAVDLAVTQARSDPRTTRFAGLVNAVLREIGRRKERALPAALAATVDAPDWFADRVRTPPMATSTQRRFAAHRIEPPVDLTVKSDAAGWAVQLGGTVLPTGGARLARLPGPVTGMPGFAEGEWWVQDAAASIPARLLGDIKGKRVADLCAAPGGKTAQLSLAGGKISAIEMNANRARRLAANLERLQLEADIVVSDLFALKPDEPFDAVLLDAPCSSTGTVRRHPDVPWTKGPDDVAKLADLQRRMLEAAVPLVRPGGTIVFSNCSLDPEEGEDLIETLLARRDDLALDPVRPGEFPFADPFLTPAGTVRTTPAGLAHGDPGLGGLDGFFAARLRRLR